MEELDDSVVDHFSHVEKSAQDSKNSINVIGSVLTVVDVVLIPLRGPLYPS
jgi:hypothetical protein